MARINTTNPHQTGTLAALIGLTRWKEQLPFATLTFLGGLIAFSVADDVTLDWRLFAVALANFLTVTFAFMINDMEDAEDDAKNPRSAARNPITNGSLDMRTAWIACAVVVAVSVGLFAVGGLGVLVVGAVNLTLSFLYSWKPVRLKSSSIGLDVVSHTLMLGGLLPLAGYLVYSTSLHPAILFMVAAATLGSTYGQLYNQIRDYDADTQAGIVNVTTRLGKQTTWVLAYLAIGLTLVCGVLAFSYMTFPAWLWLVAGSSTVIGFGGALLLQNTADASGKEALDLTGKLQPGFWFAFSVTITAWIIWAMI
jgi:4-hydroxybenzoate polyprenyltransferase